MACFSGGQILADDTPDDGGINSIIFVSQYVSNRANLRPGLSGNYRFYQTFELGRRLRYSQQTALRGVLGFAVLNKCLV